MTRKLDLSQATISSVAMDVTHASDHEVMAGARADLLARSGQPDPDGIWAAQLIEVERWLAEHENDPPDAPSRQRRAT